MSNVVLKAICNRCDKGYYQPLYEVAICERRAGEEPRPLKTYHVCPQCYDALKGWINPPGPAAEPE